MRYNKLVTLNELKYITETISNKVLYISSRNIKDYHLKCIQKFIKYSHPMRSISDAISWERNNRYWDEDNSIDNIIGIIVVDPCKINKISKTII